MAQGAARTRWRRPRARSSPRIIVRFTYADLIDAVDPGHTDQDPGSSSPPSSRATGTRPVTLTTAFFDQIVGTAILVFVIFALTTAINNPPLANLGPLIIGLLVVAIGMAWGANAGLRHQPGP